MEDKTSVISLKHLSGRSDLFVLLCNKDNEVNCSLSKEEVVNIYTNNELSSPMQTAKNETL